MKLRANPKNKKFRLQKDRITFHYRNFIKVELGIETLCQMAGMYILLLSAKSDTQTYIDQLQIMDRDRGEGPMLLQIFVYISIAYSFISSVHSHILVLSADREYFPFSSKCVAGMQAIIAITKRVMAIILFFTPSLGLFSLLRHWQVGIAIPWCSIFLLKSIEAKSQL